MKRKNLFWYAPFILSLSAVGCAVGTEEAAFDTAREASFKLEAAPPPDGLSCSGTKCVTSPNPLGDNLDQTVTWNPCNGAPFEWDGEFQFEENYDFLTIGSQEFTGESGHVHGHAVGPVSVNVRTDYSVGSPGILGLNAACETGYQEAECPHHGFEAYGVTLKHDKPGYSMTSPDQSRDQAAYHFTAKAGSHKLYFRVDTNARGDNDSFYYRVDNEAWKTMNNLSSHGLGWKWVPTTAFQLTDGPHMIEIRSREVGISFDRVALLSATAPAPSGIGGTAHACGQSRAQVGCESDTCQNGAVCCTPRLDDGVQIACQSKDECPLVNAGAAAQVSCDSHVDCNANQLCVAVRFGNFEFAYTCVDKSEAVPINGSTFMTPVCGSPNRANDPCPAPWKSCGAADGPLGLKTCGLP
jgi:hypothetical protein